VVICTGIFASSLPRFSRYHSPRPREGFLAEGDAEGLGGGFTTGRTLRSVLVEERWGMAELGVFEEGGGGLLSMEDVYFDEIRSISQRP